MRLSDLQNKDIVDMASGERLGGIIDVDVNSETGTINKLIIFEKKGLFKNFKNDNEMSIYWGDIKKIGQDVILVNKK